ncbi:MAG: alpha/beta hydrolase [Terrimicrobiaceae bacterium]
MKPVVAWFWKILFLLVVVALLLCGLLLAWAESWKADTLAALADGAGVVETKVGPQQYVLRDEGPPVLIVHGAGGGYDQAIALADAMPWEGVQIIAPSRPGYLGTPLASTLLPEQQADAFAALLDELKVEQVTVLGFAEGAPAAILFASRHPARTEKLVLISGLYERIKQPHEVEERPLPEKILNTLGGDVTSALVGWAVKNHPDLSLPEAISFFYAGTQPQNLARFVLGDPSQTSDFQAFLLAMVPISAREVGLRNDILQLKNLPPLPLANISVPTLIVHGSADPLQSAEGARAAAAKIRGATYLGVEGSGHLPWLGPDSARAGAAIANFVIPTAEAAVTPPPVD